MIEQPMTHPIQATMPIDLNGSSSRVDRNHRTEKHDAHALKEIGRNGIWPGLPSPASKTEKEVSGSPLPLVWASLPPPPQSSPLPNPISVTECDESASTADETLSLSSLSLSSSSSSSSSSSLAALPPSPSKAKTSANMPSETASPNPKCEDTKIPHSAGATVRTAQPLSANTRQSLNKISKEMKRDKGRKNKSKSVQHSSSNGTTSNNAAKTQRHQQSRGKNKNQQPQYHRHPHHRRRNQHHQNRHHFQSRQHHHNHHHPYFHQQRNSSVMSPPSTRFSPSPLSPPNSCFAIDCEMVGIRDERSMIARVTLLDSLGFVVLDVVVFPEHEILDYRSSISGITKQYLEKHASMTLSQCRELLRTILYNPVTKEYALLVGHGLKNDLECLGMANDYPWHRIRDTANYEPFQKYIPLMSSRYYASVMHKSKDAGNPDEQHHDATAHQHGQYPCDNNVCLPHNSCYGPRKLKSLAKEYLNVDIQVENKPHCPREDALAALQLYRLVQRDWENCIRRKVEKTV
mmetsp:Transcript_26108/g.72840  ORF Transcript_26108/g.72840 Transcript_26108/m.72840 type:complete len:518 (+) Transcript_26108:86-1639(+)